MLNLLLFITLALDIARATPLPQNVIPGLLLPELPTYTSPPPLVEGSPCKIKDLTGVCTGSCPMDISFADNPCSSGLDCCVAVACAEKNSGACMNREKIGNCYNGLSTSQGGLGRGLFSSDFCPGGHTVGCCVEDVNAPYTALDKLGMEPNDCPYGCSGSSGSLTKAVAALGQGGGNGDTNGQWTGGETAAVAPGSESN